jgi:hypothetical protein
MIKVVGNRDQVYSGVCQRTKSGLTKDDLILNARGKIVSKKRSEMSRATFANNIEKMAQYKQK